MELSLFRIVFWTILSCACYVIAFINIPDPIYSGILMLGGTMFFCLSVPITKYGYDILIKALLVSLPLLIIPYYLDIENQYKGMMMAGGTLILIFVLIFLRDPKREVTTNSNAIVSPADGKVLYIRKITENSKIKVPSYEIAIFMSPINVHVNRIPINGNVVSVEYITGKYLAAYKEESGENNEQTKISIKHDSGYDLIFKQISGFVARRIVCSLEPGKYVQRGVRFGMIKFGSRSDMVFPAVADIRVRAGDKVKGGSTIIAVMPS